MRPVAAYVTRNIVCLSVCPCVGYARCTKMANRSRCHFGADCCGSNNHVLGGVKIGRIHSQLQGVTRWRCGLLPSYFGPCFLDTAAEPASPQSLVHYCVTTLCICLQCAVEHLMMHCYYIDLCHYLVS